MDFTSRMFALRQAFTILTSSQQAVNYLTVAGRMLLGELAARSGRDPAIFQQAFGHLISHSQNPAYSTATRIELAQSGIFHFNFLDVVFELVVFGVLEGTMPRAQTAGGFLNHLAETINSLMPTGAWPPEAKVYLQALRGELLGFLDSILGFAQQLYSDPQPLASAVWECVEQHVQRCLDTLPYI